MPPSRHLPARLLVLACAALGAATVEAAPPSTEDLERRIAEIEAAMAALRGTASRDRARSDAVRALFDDMLADAAARDAALGEVFPANWNGGFRVGSADGGFLLRIGGEVQVRFVYNHRDARDADDGDRSGFEVSRARIKLRGHVIDPAITWVLTSQFRSGRNLRVQTASVQKTFESGWWIRGGGSVILRRLREPPAVRDQFGVVGQMGYRFTDAFEAFVRHETGNLDRPGQTRLNITTIGVNIDFESHKLELTTDVGYGHDPVSPAWVAFGSGWRTTRPGAAGQVVVRSQFQLLF